MLLVVVETDGEEEEEDEDDELSELALVDLVLTTELAEKLVFGGVNEAAIFSG